MMDMNQRIAAWLIGLWAFGAPIPGVAADREIKVSGVGVRKCAEWNRWKESRNGEARALMVDWTQGFLAGHNVFARLGWQGAAAVTASSGVILAMLDARCQASPDARLLEVVVQLAGGLGGARVELQSKDGLSPGYRCPPDDGSARGL